MVEHTFGAGEPSESSDRADRSGWQATAAAFTPAVDAPSAVVELVEAARKVADLDPQLLVTDELLAATVALEEAGDRVATASARALARVDAEDLSNVVFGHRTGAWLSTATNASKRVCQGRVRSARDAHRYFTEFTGAARDERVSWAHVQHLVRVANPRNRTELAELQAELVDQAQVLSFDTWAVLVSQLAIELDADGSYDPNTDPEGSQLQLTPYGDGTMQLEGQLAGDGAVIAEHALGTITDELRRQCQRDREADPTLEIPSQRALMGQAFIEACRRALAVDLDSTRQPKVEAVLVIEDSEASDTDNDDEGPEPVVRTDTGQVLPRSAADTLLADAAVRGLVVDVERNPLHLGRSERYATPAQRRALTVRDGGCIFPGCTMPPGWCDAHHQPAWEHDGRTNTDTMALLCRHHHRVTHRPDWRIDAHPTRPERWIWTTPSGRHLHSQRRSDHRPPPCGTRAREHRRTPPG